MCWKENRMGYHKGTHLFHKYTWTLTLSCPWAGCYRHKKWGNSTQHCWVSLLQHSPIGIQGFSRMEYSRRILFFKNFVLIVHFSSHFTSYKDKAFSSQLDWDMIDIEHPVTLRYTSCWFDILRYCNMITTVVSANTSSCHIITIPYFVVKTLKIYSLSNF